MGELKRISVYPHSIETGNTGGGGHEGHHGPKIVHFAIRYTCHVKINLWESGKEIMGAL